MKLNKKIIILPEYDGISNIPIEPGVGSKEELELLESLSETLTTVPGIVGPFFFVSKEEFEQAVDEHQYGDTRQFREWSRKFHTLSLYPVKHSVFKALINGACSEEDPEVAGDVVIFGTKPRASGEVEGTPLTERQKCKYVVYISTAEGVAQIFRMTPEDETPNNEESAIDIWPLYTDGRLDENAKRDKQDIGIHGILTQLGYPELTFLSINASFAELREIQSGEVVRTLTNSL